MKIRSVKATWLHVPLPAGKRFSHSDYGTATTFDTLLVRIETESGLVGHGEAKSNTGSAYPYRTLRTAVEEEFAPLLLGQDARDVVRLWETMYNGPRTHHALQRGRGFPNLSRRGHTIVAMSGIDMALWDLLGQSAGLPVWQLLGGRCRERLPAYASGGWESAERIGEQLSGYVKQGGFRAVKMRVGAMDGDVRTSVRRVQAAREALGPDIDIMTDAHGTFSVAEAKRFARNVADCQLAWFEEPVSPDNHRGYAEVRASTDIPIAGGESDFTRFDFLDLAQLGAVDIFQPDLARCGGITEGMRIAALASAYQIALAPHIWGGALMFAAGLQVAATSPAAFILEYSLAHNPLLHDLTLEGFPLEDGHVAITDRPGLGVTINEDFVKAYGRT